MIAATETKLPRLLMQLPGPKAKHVIEQDAKFMSPSFTRDYPLVAKRGHGAPVCPPGACPPKGGEANQKEASQPIQMAGQDFYLGSLPQFAEKPVNTVP